MVKPAGFSLRKILLSPQFIFLIFPGFLMFVLALLFPGYKPRNPFSAFAQSSTTWTYDCSQNSDVEIVGAGMGSENAITYNPQSLNISDIASINSIRAQVFVKDGYTNPSYIQISSSRPESFNLMSPNTDAGLHYEQVLQSAAWIKAQAFWSGSSQLSLRDFAGYIFRQKSPPLNYYNTGKFPHKYIYWDTSGGLGNVKTWVESFSIPAASSARTVNVTFVISNKRDSSRYPNPYLAELTAEAGGVSQTVTLDVPTNGNADLTDDEDILLYTINLSNVPAAATTANATVTSPDLVPSGNWPRGDNLYWSGVNVRVPCDNVLPTPTPTLDPSICDPYKAFPPANRFYACYYGFKYPPDPGIDNYPPDADTASNLLNAGFDTTSSPNSGPPNYTMPSPVGSATGVDQNWLTAPCIVDSTGKAQGVVATWWGNINFSRGLYKFYTLNGDGVKLFIQDVNGGSAVIDKWKDQNPNPPYNEVYPGGLDWLSLNGRKNIILQWYVGPGNSVSRTGCSQIKLWWERTDIPMNYWYQTGTKATSSTIEGNGDVHVQGDLTAMIHPDAQWTQDNYFALGNNPQPQGLFPGLVSVDGTADFGPYGGVSTKGWILASGSPPPPDPYAYDSYSSSNRYDYNYWNNKITTTPWTLGNTPIISNLNNLGSGYYKVDGDLILPNNFWGIMGGKKIVILVSGKLRIQNRIMLANPWQQGNFLMFVVNGDIEIDPRVAAPLGVPGIQGVFITSNKISTGTTGDVMTEQMLLGYGVFVAYGDGGNSFDFQRKIRIMNGPSERFAYDLNLIMQAPPQIYVIPFGWEEVAP